MAENFAYSRCGDYYIPNIKLSYTEPIEWNRFSRMARTYLKEHRPILYNDLILTERLFPYLKEIGETAMRRMEQLEAALLRSNRLRTFHRKIVSLSRFKSREIL